VNASNIVDLPARGSQNAGSIGDSIRGIRSVEAIPKAPSIEATQFNLQGNAAPQFNLLGTAAKFDLQRKNPMSSSDDLTDAKIASVEARTDTKIARMEGKLDLVVSKIDGINSRLDDVRHDYRATRANIWVVGLGLAVLIVGVAALLPVFFGMGTQIRDIIDKAIEAHMSSPTPVPPRR
jgi:hypothetical protein